MTCYDAATSFLSGAFPFQNKMTTPPLQPPITHCGLSSAPQNEIWLDSFGRILSQLWFCLGHNGELKQSLEQNRVFEHSTQPEAETILFLGSGFAQIFREIVSHDESKDT